MDRAELVAFVRRRGRAVVATQGPEGTPETGEVPIAITDDAEIIFGTSIHSREHRNIQALPQVALVIGGDDEVTVQSEGVADVLTGADLDRCLRVYFQQFPQGREQASDPDVTHIRIRPRWVRLSDLRPESYGVQEIPLDH